MQPDGKIIVAGYSDGGFALIRLNADGSLDTSFSSDGKKIVPVGSFDDAAYGVTLQPDGKIVVAGRSDPNGIDTDFSKPYYFGVIRLNADGSLDTSFSADGKVTVPVASGGAYDVTLQPDGKIILAGYNGYWDGYLQEDRDDFLLIRLNADGSLDTNFSANGKAILSLGDWNDSGNSVTLQPDGKIIVAGYSYSSDNGNSADFTLIRLNANGSLDTSFSGDGKVIVPVGSGNDCGYSVTLQPDGKIVVAGNSYHDGSSHDFAVIRLNADGTLDTTFGSRMCDTLGGTVSYVENADPIALDSSVKVNDPDLAALDGGVGNYDGAGVTLARQGGASADDQFSGLGNLAFAAGSVTLSGATIGTYTNADGTLSISFNGNATQARVNEALSSIGYANASDTPPASVQIKWTFSDGTASTPGTTTVNVTDTFDGPISGDQVIGGAGNDNYHVGTTSITIIETPEGGVDRIYSSVNLTLPANVEELQLLGGATSGRGNALDNIIRGNANHNTLYGQAGDDALSDTDGGDDTLNGGAGADLLEGGTGNDVYVVDAGGDAITENSGAGNDTVRTSLASYTLQPQLENLYYIGNGSFSGTGNWQANSLFGRTGNDTLDGMGGADTLSGGDGNDTYVVNTADVVSENAGAGNDTVLSKRTWYTLSDNIEKLYYVGDGDFNGSGNALDNTLVGGAGADFFWGNDGADLIDGLAGADVMRGGSGDDTYLVDATGDRIIEDAGQGCDTVRTSLVSYTLGDNVEKLDYTGTGAFSGTGNALANSLLGKAGADTLSGLGGNDILNGLGGADVLTGGSGADTFVFSKASSTAAAQPDRISDFKASDSDKIDLRTMDANAAVAGDQAFTFVGSAAFVAGSAAGKLRFDASTHMLYGSTDADAAAEFAIELTGVATLAAGNILL